MNDIYSYFVQNMVPPCEYEVFIEGKFKYLAGQELTIDEKIAIVTTSSYYASLLRIAYKQFVVDHGYQPSDYWNAAVKFYIFNGIWNNGWTKFFRQPEIKTMVSRTTLPEWTPLGICGCNWGDLLRRLSSKYPMAG